MPLPERAFVHHPELKPLISDPDTSFFRDLDVEDIERRMEERGMERGWRHPDAVREALRNAALEGRRDRDLWIFAYGSLMWDPAIQFVEVRRAHTDQYGRSFCLWDDGARGTQEQPGLMAALDMGEGCTGLAFRIPADQIEVETEILCRRELIAPGYVCTFVELDTAQGRVEALTFVADHSAEVIVPDIPITEQARMIAHAEGLFGTAFDYLSNVKRHLDELAIEDAYIEALCALVDKERALV
ncbi:MAG: gamma-glutamylcyclotransferase [Pseudomonadota bacterium]